MAKTDFWYGGMGYGETTRTDGRRADIISLEYALRAMKEAELPANDAAWQKAHHLPAAHAEQQRDQRSEVGGQRRRASSTTPASRITRRRHEVVRQRHLHRPSELLVGEREEGRSAREGASLKWIRDNYTVDENPGMGQKTVYYYYMVFAKALQAMGEPTSSSTRAAAATTGARSSARKLLVAAASRGLLGQRPVPGRDAGQQGARDRVHDGCHAGDPAVGSARVNEPGRARRSAVLASALIALATLCVNQAFASRVASRPDPSSAARQGDGGQDVVVRAAAGIGQAVKAERWAPVLVSIDSSRPFTGELIVCGSTSACGERWFCLPRAAGNSSCTSAPPSLKARSGCG